MSGEGPPLRLATPFGRAFVRAPAYLRRALLKPRLAPVQSDGELLLGMCYSPEDNAPLGRKKGADHQGAVEKGTLGLQEHIADVPLVLPQFTQFNVQFQDLEDWYCFFWGKDIADRKPPHSETVLLYAERNAWREIHNRVYEGSTVKEAMAAQKADTLFWQREVYERLQKPQDRTQGSKGNTPSTKGKGKTKPAWSPAQNQWSKGKPSRKASPGRALQRERRQLAQELGHSHPEGAAVLQRPSPS